MDRSLQRSHLLCESERSKITESVGKNYLEMGAANKVSIAAINSKNHFTS